MEGLGYMGAWLGRSWGRWVTGDPKYERIGVLLRWLPAVGGCLFALLSGWAAGAALTGYPCFVPPTPAPQASWVTHARPCTMRSTTPCPLPA